MRLRADRRVERQTEAIERATCWAARSTKEKLNSLYQRRGRSVRQVKRLQAIVEKEAGK